MKLKTLYENLKEIPSILSEGLWASKRLWHVDTSEWFESSEALAALGVYLLKKGFYVKSLLPWGSQQGHYLSVFMSPKNQTIRLVVSLPANSLKVTVHRWSSATRPEYDRMLNTRYDLSDPDSFPQIAARIKELAEL